MERLFVVGDIHGMYDKLISLMKKVIKLYKFNETDKLIFVGDYIDRGKDSFKVIEYLCELKNKYTNIVFLKGNHEDMLLNYIASINKYLFLINGGYDTIKSYKQHKYDLETWNIPQSHKDFFNELELYHIHNDVFIVHAGVNPERSIYEQEEEDLLWIRDEFINSDKDFEKLIVSGHTIVGDKPLVCKNKICIDTGAFLKDHELTCLILPDIEFTTS